MRPTSLTSWQQCSQQSALTTLTQPQANFRASNFRIHFGSSFVEIGCVARIGCGREDASASGSKDLRWLWRACAVSSALKESDAVSVRALLSRCTVTACEEPLLLLHWHRAALHYRAYNTRYGSSIPKARSACFLLRCGSDLVLLRPIAEKFSLAGSHVPPLTRCCRFAGGRVSEVGLPFESRRVAKTVGKPKQAERTQIPRHAQPLARRTELPWVSFAALWILARAVCSVLGKLEGKLMARGTIACCNRSY